MNVNALSILVVLISALPAGAQTVESLLLPKRGATIEDLIPEGWESIGTATGDLTGDRIDDVVMALECKREVVSEESWEENDDDREERLEVHEGMRVLGVWTAVKNKGYVLSAEEFDVIWENGMGGQFDPFSGVEIADGSFSVHFYTGSLSGRFEAWYYFTLVDDGWYLTAATEISTDLHEWSETQYDYDFVAGDATITSSENVQNDCIPCDDCDHCEQCEKCDSCYRCAELETTHTTLRPATPPLISLHNFDPNRIHDLLE